jgi:hypothetical protein
MIRIKKQWLINSLKQEMARGAWAVPEDEVILSAAGLKQRTYSGAIQELERDTRDYVEIPIITKRSKGK